MLWLLDEAPGPSDTPVVLWYDSEYAYGAAVGGQRPQARLAAVRNWADAVDCQLCHGATGALGHKHAYLAVRPEESETRSLPKVSATSVVEDALCGKLVAPPTLGL